MTSEKIIREFDLADGVKVLIRDATRHYYGGYYQVRLQVMADVPLSVAWFGDVPEYEDAIRRLGRSVRFSRTLEKMAVPLAEIETVRSSLLESFETTLLTYLSRPDFPCRFVLSEFGKARKSMVTCEYVQS